MSSKVNKVNKLKVNKTSIKQQQPSPPFGSSSAGVSSTAGSSFTSSLEAVFLAPLIDDQMEVKKSDEIGRVIHASPYLKAY